jgi:hypothetical protein
MVRLIRTVDCVEYRATSQRSEDGRYIEERTFPHGLDIPINEGGIKGFQQVVVTKGSKGVTRMHSYVSTDKRKTHCICNRPSPGAIQAAANTNRRPVDSIVEVRVPAPYFSS